MDWISPNTSMWDESYSHGLHLWYPSEALVRIVRTLERQGRLQGLTLDHGCGSGNVAEFLVRSGHTVHCTDISRSALRTVDQRFQMLMLPKPQTSLIDLTLPLGNQLPRYDNIVIWQSLYYSDIGTVQLHLQQLIDKLPKDGVFITAFPTMRDVSYEKSRPLPDGSREMIEDISGQKGAIVTVPDSPDTLVAWCNGIRVIDLVTFGITIGGITSEFYALYGLRQ